jgi:hypothetical protein
MFGRFWDNLRMTTKIDIIITWQVLLLAMIVPPLYRIGLNVQYFRNRELNFAALAGIAFILTALIWVNL